MAWSDWRSLRASRPSSPPTAPSTTFPGTFKDCRCWRSERSNLATVGRGCVRIGEQLFFVLAQLLDPVLNSLLRTPRQRTELESGARFTAVAHRRQHLDRSVWQ